jgi:two-component system chemotaxis sensor kinase CheA
LDLRGSVLPYVRLREHFNLKSDAARRESIVVVRCGVERAGIVVDELLGEHQTVIKPLSRLLNGVRGLSGSTILADGAIALIIDAPQLIDQCKSGGAPARTTMRAVAHVAAA